MSNDFHVYEIENFGLNLKKKLEATLVRISYSLNKIKFNLHVLTQIQFITLHDILQRNSSLINDYV